jgi:hypothetical protein
MIRRCPNCNQCYSSMEGAGNTDFVHQCKSENEMIEKEYVFKLDNSGWRMQGLVPASSIKKSDMYKTRQRFEYIKH